MTQNSLFVMISIAIYLGAMLYIGFRCSAKTQNQGDFYLGGRSLGPFVTAMSAEASDMSSWLLMGLPGLAYLSGTCNAFWTGIGLAFGTWINWLVVSKRIRVYSNQLGAITIPDFFNMRYKDEKNILNLVSALIIIVFFIPYTASGFAACGKLFSTLFGIDYFKAMVVSAAIIVGYTALGGFLAASTTDLVQSIVMTMALAIISIFGIHMAGGLDAVFENASNLEGFLSLDHIYIAEKNTSASYDFMKIFSTLAWGLGYLGMPHILLRFMAIKDKDKLKLSRRVATIWVVISLFFAIGIGVIGNAMTSNGTLPVLKGASSETVIIRIASVLSSSGPVYALIAGIILAGILAATMSTADSQLLAASSSVNRNVMENFFGFKLNEKNSMRAARVTVIVIALIGVFIASDPNSSVFEIVSFAWAGFGAAFGPAIILALFSKRSNKYGAITGMVTGASMIFVWKYLISNLGGIFDCYELLPSFLIALAVNITVSHLTAVPSHDVISDFEKYKAELNERNSAKESIKGNIKPVCNL